MSQIKILNSHDIEQIFNLEMALTAVESSYIQKAQGTGMVWPMVFHEFEPGKADLDIKSGNLDLDKIYGLKAVSWFGENVRNDLPALYLQIQENRFMQKKDYQI